MRTGLGVEGIDPAAVHLDDPAGDGQAEPGATGRRIGGPEPLEDAVSLLGRDAGAIVADVEDPVAAVDPGVDADDAPGRTVAVGVVEQVDDDLGETSAIGGDRQALRRDGDDMAHVPGAELGLGDAGGQQLGDVDAREGEPTGAAVDAGEVEQVVDEVGQSLGLGQGGAEGSFVGSDDTVGEVLQHGPLRGQWRAQFVRNGGDEGTALLVLGGQILGHGVERPGQRAHLVGGGDVDAFGPLPAGHAGGGTRHVLQRGHHAAGQPAGRAEGGGDRHRAGDEGGHAGAAPDGGDDEDGDGARDDEEPEFDADRRDPRQWPPSVGFGGHGRASAAYPTPWTVRIRSAPILARRALTWESRVRVP